MTEQPSRQPAEQPTNYVTSQPYPPGHPAHNPPAPKPAKKDDGFGTMVLGALVIVAVLGGIGFGVGRWTAPDSSGASVPKACTDAISEARTGFTLAGDTIKVLGNGFQLVPDVLTAAQAGDTATLNSLTSQIQDMSGSIESNTSKLNGLQFNEYAAACHA